MTKWNTTVLCLIYGSSLDAFDLICLDKKLYFFFISNNPTSRDTSKCEYLYLYFNIQNKEAIMDIIFLYDLSLKNILRKSFNWHNT